MDGSPEMWEAMHMPLPARPETPAQEIARLQREIGERQLRLQSLVLGDPRIRVTVPTSPPSPQTTEEGR